jgi:hypothetical protein
MEDDFWNDHFHYCALAAGSIAQRAGRMSDSDYVRRLAYAMYEAVKRMPNEVAGGYDQVSVSKWGMFPAPKHEPEVLEAKKRFEKLTHPVCHTVVDIKV